LLIERFAGKGSKVNNCRSNPCIFTVKPIKSR
jgi:hypothetical protein